MNRLRTHFGKSRAWLLSAILVSTLTTLVWAGLSASVSAAESLNMLVWCDHTDPKLLTPFEKKYNVKINVKEYGGTGTALALLEQSQPGDWDVFVVDSADVPRVAKAGHLAPLKESDYPFKDIFPQLRSPELHWVNGKLYAIPEKFGYNTIAYNNKKVDASDMRKTSVIWDAKYKGRVAIYDYYIPVMEMVAIGLGINPSELTAKHLPAIKKKLFLMKEQAALVGDVVQVQTALATGDVDIITGGGEYVVAGLQKENPAMDWMLPDEGGIRWMQALGVFANSKKKDLAVKFIQWVMSPKGQAHLATSACYWAMPANSKAKLTAAQKKTLRWDQQPGFLKKSYPYFIPDEKLDKAMLEVWTEMLQH